QFKILGTSMVGDVAAEVSSVAVPVFGRVGSSDRVARRNGVFVLRFSVETGLPTFNAMGSSVYCRLAGLSELRTVRTSSIGVPDTNVGASVIRYGALFPRDSPGSRSGYTAPAL